MSAFASRSILALLLLVCIAVSVSLPAAAHSVTVTATSLAGDDIADFNVTAGIFSAFSAAPGGNSVVGGGTLGVPLTLEWGASAYSGPDFANVTVGNQFTDILGGGLNFTSAFTITASDLASGTFTAPVNVSGSLSAYQDLSLGQGYWTQGPFMGSVAFAGTGTATFALLDIGQGLYAVENASVNFTGPGMLQTATPEPASLFLTGTGLAALALVVRRRRALFQAIHSDAPR